MKEWKDVKENLCFTDEENKIMDLQAEIICKIIKRRDELGISQRDLAKLTGVKQPSIARIESFKVIPKLDMVCRLIEPLGLTLDVKPKDK